MAMRTLAALCAAALGLGAQTLVHIGPTSADTAANGDPSRDPLPPDVLLLARIKVHMLDTLARQPDYTCLETVERSRRDGYTRKYRLEDTLRLEVALVE